MSRYFGYFYRNPKGQNHGPVWKTQLFLLSGICIVILWQDCYGKDSLRKILLQHGWVYVDDTKLAGKKLNISPTWKILMKDVDLGEPTSFLDHVYLGCTHGECQTNKDIVDNCRSMFESRISAGATEKVPATKATGKPAAETTSSWSFYVEGHAKKCV